MNESVKLTVTGMKCGGCESNVINKLKTIAGVLTATASSKNKQVEVEYDNEKTDLATLNKAIYEAGYTVE